MRLSMFVKLSRLKTLGGYCFIMMLSSLLLASCSSMKRQSHHLGKKQDFINKRIKRVPASDVEVPARLHGFYQKPRRGQGVDTLFLSDQGADPNYYVFIEQRKTLNLEDLNRMSIRVLKGFSPPTCQYLTYGRIIKVNSFAITYTIGGFRLQNRTRMYITGMSVSNRTQYRNDVDCLIYITAMNNVIGAFSDSMPSNSNISFEAVIDLKNWEKVESLANYYNRYKTVPLRN